MTFVFLAVAAIGQSAVSVKVITSKEGYYQYYLTNVRLGEPGAPTLFRLSVDATVTSVALQTNPQSFYWENVPPAGARDRLVFPSAKFNAAFDTVGAVENVVSLPSLSQNGVTLCNHELYTGPPPSACASKTYASTLCDDDGCWYDVERSAGHSVAKFNAALPQMPEKCARAKLVTTTGGVDICISLSNEFNIVPNHMSIHMLSPEHQVLFVNDSGTSDMEGTIFTFAIVLIMIVWTAHSDAYIALTKDTESTTNLTLTLCDVMITVVTASTFALVRSGEMFCPAEASQSAGKHGGVVSLSLTLVTILLGTFLACVFMFAALKAKTKKRTNTAKVFSIRTRCLFETVLMLVLHTHFPKPMGQTLRRSVGFFTGCTSAVIIGRDSEWFQKDSYTVASAMYYTWSLIALSTITFNLLLPITYVSAGFSNQCAPLVASTVVIVAASSGYSYSKVQWSPTRKDN